VIDQNLPFLTHSFVVFLFQLLSGSVMKSKYISLIVLCFVLGLMSFIKSGRNKIYGSKIHFPNGIDADLSGSPNSSNCSNCHGANVQSGTSMNVLTLTMGGSVVNQYIPGQTYTVALEMAINPVARGFNAVVLNSLNENTGTFAAVAGTAGEGARASGGVATHNSNSNTADWRWNWTAPLTDEGVVTFYVSTLKSDGAFPQNFITYLSQHTFSSSGEAGLQLLKPIKNNFSAGYSPAKNTVVMDFWCSVVGNMNFSLIDLSGNSVFFSAIGKTNLGVNKEKVVLPDYLSTGMYIVNLSVNNLIMEDKIMIQK
jgi:hypothetical protein